MEKNIGVDGVFGVWGTPRHRRHRRPTRSGANLFTSVRRKRRGACTATQEWPVSGLSAVALKAMRKANTMNQPVCFGLFPFFHGINEELPLSATKRGRQTNTPQVPKATTTLSSAPCS